MNRIPLFIPILIVFWVAGVAGAESPPTEPKIEFSASTGADGAVTVTGKVILPPGWKLSIHTLTIRYQKAGGSATLNAFMPLKGPEFKGTINLTAGSYQTWAVIDVKDADGREKQVSSPARSVTTN
ncbi:MAG TPA: hypothetical protein VKE40_02790 [Gemmataceae bacterium]|nr:hypothetical protein [Gemmataceae bacterium]